MKKLYLLFFFISMLLHAQTGVWEQRGPDLNGPAGSDLYNELLSISADGNRVVIGSVGGGPNQEGAARIFELINGNWQQVGNTLLGPSTESGFGEMVTISASGSVVAVVEQSGEWPPPEFNIVRVYQLNGNSWELMGSPINIDNSPEVRAVRLSEDGSILSVAERGAMSAVFRFVDGDWTQWGGGFDEYPLTMDMTSDGSTVVLGNNFNSTAGFQHGRVRVYKNINDSWEQIGQDLLGAHYRGGFGVSVAINDIGDRLVVGSPYSEFFGDDTGHVEVYELQSGSWVKISQDFYPPWSGAHYGGSVDINAAGDVIAIGGPRHGNDQRGYVKCYEYDGTTWHWRGLHFEGEGSDSRLGKIVKLDATGSILAFAGEWENGQNTSGFTRTFAYDDSVLAFSDVERSSFGIYPNPVKDRLFIDKIVGAHITSIKLYDVSGRLVHFDKENSAYVDVSHLQSGLLIIVIGTEEGFVTERIIKE